MTDQQLTFAEGFPMPTYDEWVGEVEKALKGAPFDKKMLNRTYEGITLRPIYTRNDWPPDGDPSGFPGAMPFTRGGHAAGSRVDNWDVRQAFAYPDPAVANETILHDLERGVTSLLIQFDKAARAGLDGDAGEADGLAGDGGVMLYSVDDLDLLLTGVYLDLITSGASPRRSISAGGGPAERAVATARHRSGEGARRLQRRSPRHPGRHRRAAGPGRDRHGPARRSGPPYRGDLFPGDGGCGRHLGLPQRRRNREPGSGGVDGDGGRLPPGHDRCWTRHRQRLSADRLYLFGQLRSVPVDLQAARRAQDVGADCRGLRRQRDGARDESSRHHRRADDEPVRPLGERAPDHRCLLRRRRRRRRQHHRPALQRRSRQHHAAGAPRRPEYPRHPRRGVEHRQGRRSGRRILVH